MKKKVHYKYRYQTDPLFRHTVKLNTKENSKKVIHKITLKDLRLSNLPDHELFHKASDLHKNFMKMRKEGHTISSIAKHHKVSPATVYSVIEKMTQDGPDNFTYRKAGRPRKVLK